MDWFRFNAGDFGYSFLSVLLEGIPFLLLGSVVSGIVDAYVSPERLAKALPKSKLGAVFVSGLLGLIFPLCECGSVVVIRRFLKKGLPLGCAVSYMLAAPIVSPIVAFSTYAAFLGQNPLEMTVLRLALGYAIAVGVATLLQRLPERLILQPEILGNGAGATAGTEAKAQNRRGLRIGAMQDGNTAASLEEATQMAPTGKFQRALFSAASDFLDVAVFFVVGAALTSVLGTAVHHSVLEPFVAVPWSIFMSMIMAAAMALCSTTDAFIAATGFPAFPMTAKLAFLVFGPMFDLKLFWLYRMIFRPRVVAMIGIGLFLIIGLICWRLNGIVF